jgi:molecular chaperone GrpE
MTEEKKPTLEQAPEVETTHPASPEVSLEQQVSQLTQLLNDSKDAFLRAKAEAENTRRRGVEDVAKAHKFAIESFAEYLLPVMDSMHAAMEHHNEDITKLKEGVELTLKQMKGALEKGKIVEIHPEIGGKFDPHHHQAIATVASDQESNTIVTVLQKGYLIADRVLRPALVTVSQPK